MFKTSPWFYLASQTDFIDWFYFRYWRSLRPPQAIAVFIRQKSELFGVLRSSCPEFSYEKSILKNIAKFGKHLCRSFLFNKVAGWKPPTILKRDLGTGVPCEFYEILKNTYFVKHPRTAASVHCHANINLEKSLLVPDVLLINLI